jgi:diaminohydroxyphosphoribosylaminopyrimidine deaminase/5-amino-6-(5-phosphoribosylamino)uracil reductase
MFSPADEHFMAHALRIAARGLFPTTPNPRVGCVIVRDGAIVGEGFHARAGEPHAETNALRAAGEHAAGATVYLTLEPCSHHGRTPPCVEALIAAKVRRVVAAMQDPNPKVRRRAAQPPASKSTLACRYRAQLNIGRWHVLAVLGARQGRGLTDGQDRARQRRSQWITGAEARADGHRWRARACAILTGIGTVKDDDPQLTVRAVETPRQPLKVLVDSRLEAPPDARLFADGNALVATAVDDREKAAVRPGRRGRAAAELDRQVELADLMRELARRELNEIHVEAGFKLNGSLVAAGVVDELLVYLAPSLIGESGSGMFNLPALDDLAQRRRLVWRDVLRVGEDLRVVARFAPTA